MNVKQFFSHKRAFIIGGAVLLCICLIACSVLIFSGKKQPEKTHYGIEAQYDPETQTVRGHMTLDYVNNSGATLEKLYLHLYPNAYADESSAPFLPEDKSAFYPNGFSFGGIETDDITLNGRDVPVHLEGTSNQLLCIEHALKNGRSAKIEMSFTLTLPESASRLGYSGELVSLGNWYPIMSVFENGAWRNEEYCRIGDPFYSEISDYTVRLTVPEKLIPAMSGKSVKISSENGKNTWECTSENIRDFACVIGPFQTATQTVGQTEVSVFFTGETGIGEQALNYACSALEIYNRLFGDYPYKSYQVAAAPLMQGGMEYPCLSMINSTYFTTGGMHRLEYTVAHETAHQWWYGIVGSDPINDAWLDEGLATYSSMLYYEQTKPEATARAYFKYYVSNSFRFARTDILQENPNTNMQLSRPLQNFESNTVYEMLCYQKSALMLQSLRKQLGDSVFMEGMRSLCRDNRFSNLTKEKLAAAFSAQSKLPIDSIIDAWLNDRVILP